MNPEEQFKENESTCKEPSVLLDRIPEEQFKENESICKELSVLLDRIPEEQFKENESTCKELSVLLDSVPEEQFEENESTCKELSVLLDSVPEEQFKKKESTCKELSFLLDRIPEDIVRKCLTGSINLKHTTTKLSISAGAKGKSARDNQHELFLNKCFAVGSNSESESTGEYCERTIEENANSLSDLRDTLLSNDTQVKMKPDDNVSDKGNKVHQMNVLKNVFSDQAIVVEYTHASKKQTCSQFINNEIKTPSTKTKSRNFVKTKKGGSKQLHRKPALKNLKIMCEKLPHDVYQIYSKHISVRNVLKNKNIACNLQNVQQPAISSNYDERQSSQQANGMVTNFERKDEYRKNLSSDVNVELQTNCSHLDKEVIDKKATFKDCTKDCGRKYLNKELSRISPSKKIVKKTKSNGMKNKEVEPFQKRSCSDQIKSAQEMNGISNTCSPSKRAAQEQLDEVIGFLSVEDSDNTYLQNRRDKSLKKSVKPESVNKRFKYCHSMATKNMMRLENQVKNTNKKLSFYETVSDFQNTIAVGSNISAKQSPSNSQNFSSDEVKISYAFSTDKSENFLNGNQKRKFKWKQKEKFRAKEVVEILKEKKYLKSKGKKTSSKVLCTEILAVGIDTSKELIEKSKSDSSNTKSENSLQCDLPSKKCNVTKLLRKLEKRMKKLEAKGCMKQLGKKRTGSETFRGLQNMSTIEFVSLLSHHKKLASYFIKLLHKRYAKRKIWSQNDSFDKTVFRSKLLCNENKSDNFLEENLDIYKTSEMKNTKKVGGQFLNIISSEFQNTSTTENGSGKASTENGSGKTSTENGSGKTSTENGSGKTSSISQKSAKHVCKIQKEFSTNYSQETRKKIDQIKKVKSEKKSKNDKSANETKIKIDQNIKKVKSKTKANKDKSARETKIKIDKMKKVKSKPKSKKEKCSPLLKSDAKVKQLHSNLKKQRVSIDTQKEDSSVKQKLPCSNLKTCIVVLPRLSDSTCNSHNDKLSSAVRCQQNDFLKSDDKTNSPLVSVLKRNNHSRSPNPKKVTFNIENSEGCFPFLSRKNDVHVNDVCAQAIDTAAFNVSNFGIKPVKVVLKPLNMDPKLSSVEKRNCTILEKLTSPVASILTDEIFSKTNIDNSEDLVPFLSSKNDVHINDVCTQAIDPAAFNANNFGIKPVKVVLKSLNTDPKLSSVEKRNCAILEKPTSPGASILTNEMFSKTEKLHFGEEDNLYSVNDWEEHTSPFFSNDLQLSFNGSESSSERVSVDSSSNKSIVEFFDSNSPNQAVEGDVVDACMNEVLVTSQKQNVENDIIRHSPNAKAKRRNTTPTKFLKKYNSLKYRLGFLHKSKVSRIQHALAFRRRGVAFKKKQKKKCVKSKLTT